MIDIEALEEVAATKKAAEELNDIEAAEEVINIKDSEEVIDTKASNEEAATKRRSTSRLWRRRSTSRTIRRRCLVKMSLPMSTPGAPLSALLRDWRLSWKSSLGHGSPPYPCPNLNALRSERLRAGGSLR